MAKWKASKQATNYEAEVLSPWFVEINETLGDLFDSYGFEGEIYNWPRPTETVERGEKTSPREISDTRNAAESYTGVSIGPRTYRHSWGGPEAPYVADIFTGDPIRNKPGRDWIGATLTRFSLEDLNNLM